MSVAATITVTHREPGWHAWPDAPAVRHYLSERHRHLFGYQLTLPVSHGEREIEFHDVLDWLVAFVREVEATDMGAEASCETRARWVAQEASRRWERPATARCSEDDECWATVEVTP